MLKRPTAHFGQAFQDQKVLPGASFEKTGSSPQMSNDINVGTCGYFLFWTVVIVGLARKMAIILWRLIMEQRPYRQELMRA